MPDAPKPLTPRDHLSRAADRAARPEHVFRHPWNPASELRGYRLGAPTGLRRVGVNLVRIPPGKESFVFHRHHQEEEFAYVLSGRGVAEVGDDSFEIGPGDFLGFPAGGPAHHIRNPHAEDLVYLSGGENREIEVADFPRLGRRMVRFPDAIAAYPLEPMIPFF